MNNVKNNRVSDHDIKIGVVGGDQRQLVMASELAEAGYETAVYAFDTYKGGFGEVTRCISLDDALRGSAAIVLPMPYSTDNIRLNCPLSLDDIKLSELFDKFTENQVIVGGLLTENAYELAAKRGVKIIDYYTMEELCVANAVPTAEGAVAIAMNELPITIHKSKVLVLGFGRVGKTLSSVLSALGADITVTARKHEDLAWIDVYGYKSLHTSELLKSAVGADVIFNTIPDLILNESVLSNLNRSTLVIDLASKPGGVDMKAAKDLNINVIWALSLPGKVAPVTAGRIIKNTLLNILKSEKIIRSEKL